MQKAAAAGGMTGAVPLEWTRGESVFVVVMNGQYIGHVEEGLGTKNLVSDALRHMHWIIENMVRATCPSYYDQNAQCAIAMIANDMATLGISPVSIAMHIAFGDSGWVTDAERAFNLADGWKRSCDLSRAIWGCGETPTLKGIVVPGTALLSGSAWGVSKTGKLLDPATIRAGDLIVILESSGIHANGLTLARAIGERKDNLLRKLLNIFASKKYPLRALPKGYLTELPDGRSYGETLLDATHIYCDYIEDLIDAGIDAKYGINITGHGWRKIMRAPQTFAYVIDRLPTQLPIFDFIQRHGPVSDDEAYGNLNMGAGFAVIIAKDSAQKFLEFHNSKERRFKAFIAGRVEESPVKKVVIVPKNLTFSAETLAVR